MMRRNKAKKKLVNNNPKANPTKPVKERTKPFFFSTKVDTLFATDEDLEAQDQISTQKLLYCVISNKLNLATS